MKEKKYDFDLFIERRGTNSIKFDFTKEIKNAEDILPLWVADMDFEAPDKVKQAILTRAQHGIYGYTKPKKDYFELLVRWMKKRHNWETKPEWYIYTPGVVFGIAMAIRAFTKKGDGVLIQRPVYYPFSNIIENNGRKLVNNPLIYSHIGNDNGYRMNLQDLEEKIVKYKIKLFLLCNPHNPVGRVWTKKELEEVGDICIKHKVIILSDEIHEDFIYPGYKHEVFANIKEEFRDYSIIFTSPSKTFNLAGLQISNTVIANKKLRDAMIEEINKTGYDEPNIFGMIACYAAYSGGEEWLEELKMYLRENLNWVKGFLEENIPQIKLVEPQGTYLIWLDCRELKKTEQELEDLLVNKAKLWLDRGTMFGEEGKGFQRVNIATTKAYLQKAFFLLKESL